MSAEVTTCAFAGDISALCLLDLPGNGERETFVFAGVTFCHTSGHSSPTCSKFGLKVCAADLAGIGSQLAVFAGSSSGFALTCETVLPAGTHVHGVQAQGYRGRAFVVVHGGRVAQVRECSWLSSSRTRKMGVESCRSTCKTSHKPSPTIVHL